MKQLENKQVNSSAEELIQEINLFINHNNNNKNNISNYNEANQQASKLLKKVDQTLESYLFANRKIKFERNDTKLKANLIGEFIYESSTSDASILSPNEMKDLMKLINFSDETKWCLVYRASKHGFSSCAFHSRCDTKRNTLVLIKTANSNVFGGFTRKKWSGANCFKTDPSAFMFSFKNELDKPIQMKCYRPACAIYCNPEFGPSFGRTDLVIKNNSNDCELSWSHLGHTYSHPNFGYESLEAKTFLAGAFNFKTVEIEVFCLE